MPHLTGVLLGGVALSVVHALIPNHWLPFVLLGGSGRWSRARLVGITALGGSFHVLSTVLIGVVVGMLGYELSRRLEVFMHGVAPAILAALGIGLLIADALGRGHRHKHILEYEHDVPSPRSGEGEGGGDASPPTLHSHHPAPRLSDAQARVSLIGIITAMFFSPCVELEAYYIWAGGLGWLGIGALSAVYFVVTVGLMVGLVLVASRHFAHRLHFLEHHERLVMGLVFLALAVVAYALG